MFIRVHPACFHFLLTRGTQRQPASHSLSLPATREVGVNPKLRGSLPLGASPLRCLFGPFSHSPAFHFRTSIGDSAETPEAKCKKKLVYPRCTHVVPTWEQRGYILTKMLGDTMKITIFVILTFYQRNFCALQLSHHHNISPRAIPPVAPIFWDVRTKLYQTLVQTDSPHKMSTPTIFTALLSRRPWRSKSPWFAVMANERSQIHTKDSCLLISAFLNPLCLIVTVEK